MGQVTLAVEKCGCYVQQEVGIEENVKVVYCPKHGAAPMMYEALREIWILTATKCHEKESKKINDLSSKSLAKAEGR